MAEEKNINVIKKMALASKPKPYVPTKSSVKLEEEKNNNQQQEQQPSALTDEDEQVINDLCTKLDGLIGGIEKNDFSPIEFEKDDDTNFHIEFIDATANLRATNY